ncbi:hypothetical protein ACHAPO_007046 [Fusarium lateritium]
MAGFIVASPVPESATLDKRAKNDYCGKSTFVNRSSRGSPLVKDCRRIARNIAKGGSWKVGAGGEHHQQLQYGTCAFGIQGAKTQINRATIGNQDVIDLINDSIKKFQWKGRVGAEGVMSCKGWLDSRVDMKWGIYHD